MSVDSIVDLLVMAYDQGCNEKELDKILDAHNTMYTRFEDKYSAQLPQGIGPTLSYIKNRQTASVNAAYKVYASIVDGWHKK